MTLLPVELDTGETYLFRRYSTLTAVHEFVFPPMAPPSTVRDQFVALPRVPQHELWVVDRLSVALRGVSAVERPVGLYIVEPSSAGLDAPTATSVLFDVRRWVAHTSVPVAVSASNPFDQVATHDVALRVGPDHQLHAYADTFVGNAGQTAQFVLRADLSVYRRTGEMR